MKLDRMEHILMEIEREDHEEVEIKVAESKMNRMIEKGLKSSRWSTPAQVDDSI